MRAKPYAMSCPTAGQVQPQHTWCATFLNLAPKLSLFTVPGLCLCPQPSVHSRQAQQGLSQLPSLPTLALQPPSSCRKIAKFKGPKRIIYLHLMLYEILVQLCSQSPMSWLTILQEKGMQFAPCHLRSPMKAARAAYFCYYLFHLSETPQLGDSRRHLL